MNLLFASGNVRKVWLARDTSNWKYFKGKGVESKIKYFRKYRKLLFLARLALTDCIANLPFLKPRQSTTKANKLAGSCKPKFLASASIIIPSPDRDETRARIIFRCGYVCTCVCIRSGRSYFLLSPDAPLSKTKLNYSSRLPSPRVTESNKWNRGMPEESLTKLLSPLIELRDPFPDSPSPTSLSFFYIDPSRKFLSYSPTLLQNNKLPIIENS